MSKLPRFVVTEPIPLRELIRRYLRWCLWRAGGNGTVAAKLAGCSRRTIYNYTKVK